MTSTTMINVRTRKKDRLQLICRVFLDLSSRATFGELSTGKIKPHVFEKGQRLLLLAAFQCFVRAIFDLVYSFFEMLSISVSIS